MKNKYRNIKCQYKGIKFDSKKELEYYLILKDRESRGEIKEIICQLSIQLISCFTYNEEKQQKCSYVADFHYYDNELKKTIIVDVKSDITRKLPVYKIKTKLLKLQLKDKNDILFVEIV